MADRPAADAGQPRHGGALFAAARQWDIPVEDWLDLSTGINPRSYPSPDPTPGDLTRLPDPARLAALVDTARAAYGVPASAAIVAVSGTDLAIRLLPLLLTRGEVAVLSPTYSGHAEAWRAAGHRVCAVADLAAAQNADVVVLANPNNPDGRQYAPEALRGIAAAASRRLLAIDEAFCDLAPEVSLVPRMPARTLVLRSFGKFYGLAGLRLGFVIGDAALVGSLAALLGDWPISGPAITAGLAALSDRAWATETRARLAADRARLDTLLMSAGLDTIEGTDLFRSVLTPIARPLHEALARRGIWTRIFAEDERRLRIGLPPLEAFGRLEASLPEAVAEARRV